MVYNLVKEHFVIYLCQEIKKNVLYYIVRSHLVH